jgi:sec-independent protein translocase protein TatC
LSFWLRVYRHPFQLVHLSFHPQSTADQHLDKKLKGNVSMAKKKTSEDLFEESKMSFGSHIEELRVALLRALIGIGIGFAIGLWLGPHVVTYLQKPLTRSIEEFERKRTEKEYGEAHQFVPPNVNYAMEHLKLAPKDLHIEVAELARAMRESTSNDIVAEEDIRVSYDPEQLKIEDVKPLCKKLLEGDAPKTIAVRECLSPSDLEKLKSLSASDAIEIAQRDQAIAILNRLLDNASLYQSPAFKRLIAGDAKLVAQRARYEQPVEGSEPDANMLRSLNQYLLNDTISAFVSPPTLAFTQIRVWEPVVKRAQSLGIQEPFMVWLKAGFFTGMAIASPWVFLQIWSFVATGLYPHEKNYVYLYMPFSLFLFICGAAFAFYVVFKYVLDFLFTFNSQMGIDPDPRIGEYLGFVMILPLGFGFAFQLPLVMLFLHRIGLISVKSYLSKWRIAILVICVVSTVFTPTDPISMIMMALPLIGLYFLGILLCKWMPRGRNPFSEGYDPA